MSSTPFPPIRLLDGDTFLIDNSTLETFTTCPRALFYSLLLRKRTSGDRVPLRFGGIVHKVLEERYHHAEASTGYAQTDTITAQMLAVAEREFLTFTPPEDDFRNLNCVSSLIERYADTYPFENFTIVQSSAGRAIEVPFAVPVGNVPVDDTLWVQHCTRSPDGDIVPQGEPEWLYLRSVKVLLIGKIDLIYRSSGGLYILDHKTSSISTNMAEFELAQQFYGYSYAAEHLIGEPVVGFVINRMVCRKPTRTGEAFVLERRVFPTQRGLLAEWQSDILTMVSGLFRYAATESFPKHTTWCVGKFGACQFHKVCSLGDVPDALSPQRRMMLDSGEYVTNDWSPLKKEGTT